MTQHTLDMISERWTMRIVKELLPGPRRFGELRSRVAGISANVLTGRLDKLERGGVLRRRLLPAPASVQVYELTEWGKGAAAVVRELEGWAARRPVS